MSGSVVLGARYPVLLLVVPMLAAPAIATTWNEIDGTANADHIRGTAFDLFG
jgi:hypothetical protein